MPAESIEELEEEETKVRGKSHLHELEQRWQVALSEATGDAEVEYLVHHNRFRIRNISKSKEKKTRHSIGLY